MFRVCFDVDGTLIDYLGEPRQEVINLLKAFQAVKGVKVYVWSGGGVGYAKAIVDRLGLDVEVIAKGSIKPGLAIDDQYVVLGDANLRTNPLNSENDW